MAALKRRALDRFSRRTRRAPNAWRGSRARAICCGFTPLTARSTNICTPRIPNLWVWPDWPEEYRDPASAAVETFRAEHEREILFHGWLQWLIDLPDWPACRNTRRDAGMSIGLYHDLALATDRCGSDLGGTAFFVPGCRVGSPPDDFSPTGQDWSFPPPESGRHRADGYRLYAESIRKSCGTAGRCGSTMSCGCSGSTGFPKATTPKQGAYVRDRANDLVRMLALESVRNKAVIVGEDLGTVEPEVRETLARFRHPQLPAALF